MKFAIYGPPELTRQLIERAELDDRAQRLHTRCSVAIARLDKALKPKRHCRACGFGLTMTDTHCPACTYGYGDGRIETAAMPDGFVSGRESGTYKALPDGTIAPIEYYSGGAVLSVR